MKFSAIVRTLAISGLLTLVACSAEAETPNAKQLHDKLQQLLPGRDITSVSPSPMKGVYEVVVGGHQIIYTDLKGDYVLIGEMIDMKNKVSLTQARAAELSRTDFSKLPFDQSFKEVRGDGSRKLAVFSDPDCPFCKRLENDSLAGVTNVTIYTFLFPLNIHPDAERKSKLMWCAADRDGAWRDWMDHGKLPDNKGDCDTPIERNLALGDKLGITGTPALIFANGRLVSGAIPKEQLEQLLAKGGPDQSMQ
ncbi:thiol:disulfide interchange protein DsbC [Silvimonas terrae]|uniref:Thiol:disulfide interchange protein n=1 Tax=Silvimonas terrae TaxID=300266 RepID=A0A840RJN0_9NEIS|nr:DsbC family protein [Silvimonas terrae]MBB5192794.1 thiol:disulfide interchange protein DsbC [Silvimonas terrae]